MALVVRHLGFHTDISGYINVWILIISRFCEEAVRSGMDIFRIFDSLNYFPNIKIGMEAVGNAGNGFVLMKILNVAI